MPRQHIRSLDLLRGLAALAVCLYHSAGLFGLRVFGHHAYLAVDFFFALSGFILVARYEQDIKQGLSLRSYWIQRLARLYPLFFLMVAVGALLTLYTWMQTDTDDTALLPFLMSLGANLFVLPALPADALRPDHALFPFLAPGWSVFWELVVSAAFFVWVKGGSRFAALGWLGGVVLLAVATRHTDNINGGWQAENIMTGGLRALAGFSGGIVAARLAHWVRTSASAAQRRAVVAVGLAALACAFTYMEVMVKARLDVELALVLVGFPLVITGLSMTPGPVFNNRFGDLLGGLSYSLYLTHEAVLDITHRVTRAWFPSFQPNFAFGFVWLCGVLALSYLCWKTYEIPARRWYKARLEHIAPPKPVLA
jgi:peptidoglycan/LPS O-acetylase OafA/YrhL